MLGFRARPTQPSLSVAAAVGRMRRSSVRESRGSRRKSWSTGRWWKRFNGERPSKRQQRSRPHDDVVPDTRRPAGHQTGPSPASPMPTPCAQESLLTRAVRLVPGKSLSSVPPPDSHPGIPTVPRSRLFAMGGSGCCRCVVWRAGASVRAASVLAASPTIV